LVALAAAVPVPLAAACAGATLALLVVALVEPHCPADGFAKTIPCAAAGEVAVAAAAVLLAAELAFPTAGLPAVELRIELHCPLD
jgi:hypothetical protein